MEIRDKINSVGIKATPQRRAVYQVMQELCHTSIDEVIEQVRAQNPSITVSTIYRIMDSFCEAGLLSKFVGINGRTIFDITPEIHYHIFTSEGKVLDLKNQEIPDIIKKNLTDQIPLGEEIDRISIKIITRKKD